MIHLARYAAADPAMSDPNVIDGNLSGWRHDSPMVRT